MEELIRQAPIIVGIVYAVILMARQLPVWTKHGPALDPYVPLLSAVLVAGLTVVLIVSRDLDVDIIDVLSVLFVSAAAPTGVHEARKAAAGAVTSGAASP
jgi:hypothetical protein